MTSLGRHAVIVLHGKMEDPILVGNDCPVEIVGGEIEKNIDRATCIKKWTDFAENIELDPNLCSELTTSLLYRRTQVSKVYSEATLDWCKRKQSKAFLDSFCDILDKTGLFDAADALRQNFLLKPKERDLKVSEDDYQRVADHISENISTLTSTTQITEELVNLVSKLPNQTEKEKNFQSSDKKAFITKATFYRIFIYRPSMFSELIQTLEKNEQFQPAWTLRRFYRKSESN